MLGVSTVGGLGHSTLHKCFGVTHNTYVEHFLQDTLFEYHIIEYNIPLALMTLLWFRWFPATFVCPGDLSLILRPSFTRPAKISPSEFETKLSSYNRVFAGQEGRRARFFGGRGSTGAAN